MPNKERVRLLVEALRSGEYRQGTGMLHQKHVAFDEFCCLGVACDIAIKNGLEITTKADEDYSNEMTYDGETTFLPRSVWVWYGFHTDDPVITQDSATKITATVANDTHRWNFVTIADAFEKTYLNDETDS